MKYVRHVSWILGITICAVSLLRSQEGAVDTNGTCAMVVRSLEAYKKLEPGMTRAKVETHFQRDGGIFTRSKGRYVYKECPFIKLEVEYAPDPDQPMGLGSPGDVVKSLSTLTIDYTTTD